MLRAISSLALASVATAVSYDYVVIGAGTSGLVIANRLSELKNVTVAIIEAGDSALNNTDVSSPSGYGLAFGTGVDYAYQSTNQTYAGGAKQTLRAGKAIGGTSTINGMAYTRAEDIQVDTWSTIGNDGWNWDNLFSYYKKSQKLILPTDAEVSFGASYDPAVNGLDGPLITGWKNGMNEGIHSALNETFHSLGVPWNEDVNGGRMRGVTIYPATVDPKKNVREDAGRAYYYPIANRTNLHLYTNTFAQRITWESSATIPTANGVEVLAANSTTPYTIFAKAEVIVSAGALASPLILELSGIGNPDVLNKYNIPVVVDLPTVGENLQDQMNGGGFNLDSANNKTYNGTQGYVTYPTAEDIFGDLFANTSAAILASLPAYADKVAIASGNVTKASDLLPLFEIQHNLIFNTSHSVPIAEILITPSGTVFDIEYWALLPFSRGNIHIASSTPGVAADINPNFFMLDWDITEQVQTAKFIRKIVGTAPFSSLVSEETKPGLDLIPADATEEEWFNNYITGSYRSNYHPVATAAMMPKEKGGVVDTAAKVYGTANVRVVDASILPYQVCGHLVSTLYAVSERIADMIKSEL